LANEVVEARPVSRGYRLRKLVLRNKGAVTAGAAVAAAVLLGAVAFAWQAKVARQQRDSAVQARKLADDQRNRAVAAETEARRRAEELHKVADFQNQMLAQVDPTSAGVKLTEDVRARFDASLTKSGVPDEQRPAATESFANQWSRVNATDAAREFIDFAILKPAVAAIDKQFVEQPEVAASLRTVLAERYHDIGLDEAALR